MLMDLRNSSSFDSLTFIRARISLRGSRYDDQRRAERQRERAESSRLPDETESHQNGRECGGHWFRDSLEPGWQASSLLPGLFQDRRVSRSHTCIINETCRAARAINFDVQIRSDTDTTLTTKRHPPRSNFSKRGRNTSCLTLGVRFAAMAPVLDRSLSLTGPIPAPSIRSRAPLTLIGPQNAPTRTI